MSADDFIEISFVYKDEDNNYRIENIYAQRLNNYYQIKAVPAFIENIAYGDIVSVENDKGQLFFDELIESSGHSVIHIAILKPEFSENLFAFLISKEVGINYLHNNKYIVVDIPVHINYSELKLFLDNEFRFNNIDYKEACISDAHRSPQSEN